LRYVKWIWSLTQSSEDSIKLSVASEKALSLSDALWKIKVQNAGVISTQK